MFFFSSGAVEEQLDGQGPRRRTRLNVFVGFPLGGAAVARDHGAARRSCCCPPASRSTSLSPGRAARRASRCGKLGARVRDRRVLRRDVRRRAGDDAVGGLHARAVLRLAVGQVRRARARRRGSTSSMLVVASLAVGVLADRRRPGQGDRVLGRVLRGRAAADLLPDPGRRQRPGLHGRARQRRGRPTRSRSVYLVIIVVVVRRRDPADDHRPERAHEPSDPAEHPPGLGARRPAAPARPADPRRRRRARSARSTTSSCTASTAATSPTARRRRGHRAAQRAGAGHADLRRAGRRPPAGTASAGPTWPTSAPPWRSACTATPSTSPGPSGGSATTSIGRLPGGRHDPG